MLNFMFKIDRQIVRNRYLSIGTITILHWILEKKYDKENTANINIIAGVRLEPAEILDIFQR